MNYEKIYDQLINHRKQNPIADKLVGTERHHIKPRSLFPELEKDRSNIVRLTCKEHFLAHHLLFCMYVQKFGQHDSRTIKMAYAFKRMQFDRKHHCKITAKQYERVRQIVAKDVGETSHRYWRSLSKDDYRKFAASHVQRGKDNGMYGKGYLLKGSNNGAYGKKWICNPASNEQRYVPEEHVSYYMNNGWRLGLLRKSKGTTGTKWMNNGTTRKSVSLDKVQQYLDLGWRFGFRLTS